MLAGWGTLAHPHVRRSTMEWPESLWRLGVGGMLVIPGVLGLIGLWPQHSAWRQWVSWLLFGNLAAVLTILLLALRSGGLR